MAKKYDGTYSSEGPGPNTGGFPVGDAPYTSGVAGGRSLIRRERMRARTTVTIQGLDAAIALFERVPDALFQQLSRRVAGSTIIMQQEIVRAIRQRHKVRTGGWIRSWQARVLALKRGGPGQLAGGTVVGHVDSAHPASFLHATNRSTTIHSKGRRMPVPLSEEAKRVGHPRNMEGRLQFLYSKKTGRMFKVEKVGDQTIYHYELRKSVTIQGSGYLEYAIDKAAGRIFQEVGEGVHLAVEQG